MRLPLLPKQEPKSNSNISNSNNSRRFLTPVNNSGTKANSKPRMKISFSFVDFRVQFDF